VTTGGHLCRGSVARAAFGADAVNRALGLALLAAREEAELLLEKWTGSEPDATDPDSLSRALLLHWLGYLWLTRNWDLVMPPDENDGGVPFHLWLERLDGLPDPLRISLLHCIDSERRGRTLRPGSLLPTTPPLMAACVRLMPELPAISEWLAQNQSMRASSVDSLPGVPSDLSSVPHWARPADEWIRRLAPVSEDLDARGAAFISNCFDEISVVLDAPREVQLRGLEAVLTAAADQRDRVKLTDPANADLITATLRAEVFVRPYLAWLLEGEGRCEDAVRTMLPVLMATAILIDDLTSAHLAIQLGFVAGELLEFDTFNRIIEVLQNCGASPTLLAAHHILRAQARYRVGDASGALEELSGAPVVSDELLDGLRETVANAAGLLAKQDRV
jgi:hypothetical protein